MRLTSIARGAFGRISRRFSGGYFQHQETARNNESVVFEFSEENYKKVEEILGCYPAHGMRSAVIPLLTLAQKQNNNFLSISAMRKVAKILGINEMDVYEVASFYTMFNREPVGRFHLQICGTTPCLLRGCQEVIRACEDFTGAKLGETSKDGLFTLQEVECLGACANAPMVQVNGEWVYEDLDYDNTRRLLEALKSETDVKGPQNGRNCAEGVQGRTSLDKGFKTEVFTRDFKRAKEDWEEAERKRLEEEKRKAEEAKRLEEEKRQAQAKKV
jgi:NADH dehydrogenase (ubiquinone) flavoprotein 2